jgi:hypothetical protein
MATGGDIIEITYNHPTIGSGVIYPKAAEDNTFDLGGVRAADDMAMVDGGGNMIDQMNRGRWSVETLCVNDMNSQNEMEKCNDLAASAVLADWTFTHINGTVYVGKGKPVGDLSNNVNQSTFTLKVSGGGKLKKQ